MQDESSPYSKFQHDAIAAMVKLGSVFGNAAAVLVQAMHDLSSSWQVVVTQVTSSDQWQAIMMLCDDDDMGGYVPRRNRRPSRPHFERFVLRRSFDQESRFAGMRR